MAEGDHTEAHVYDPQKDASAQEPLNANELKLVTRLFGDPFAFPMEFKAWLRGWLEEQFPRIGTLTVAAASGAAGAFVPPAGAVMPFGGDSAPGGYVLCDGAQYDKTGLAYQRLWAAIGYKFGGSGNLFNVPDLQERVPVGRGALAYLNTVGQTEGLGLGARGTRHQHGTHAHGAGSHVHGTYRDVVYLTPGGTGYSIVGTGYSDGPATGPASGSTDPAQVGPGGTPTDGPAFIVFNWIISLGS